MKSSFLLITALAAFAAARNCTPGLYYCGRTLDAIGNYQGQIDQALRDSNQPEANNGRDILFYCVGGANGVIQYIGGCANGCVDGGEGKNDYCK